MSLHSYTSTGGQVGYVQPSTSYQYQQPSHSSSLYDPNAFRQFYAGQLTTLTFNSRPIIQSLSMLAQEYSRMSDIVVQCIEGHIRRVQPPIKLPAWYLLDALCKNVPVPYARLFAPMVSDLFLESYRVVDAGTRHKMEEMLWTWRDGGPNGRELFGIGPQESIERSISAYAPRHMPPPLSRPTSIAPPEHNAVSRHQVLSDLENALVQQERRLQITPYDHSINKNMEVLQQLRALVRTTDVKHHELVAIDKQLRQMVPPPAPVSQQSYPPISHSVPSMYDTRSQPPIPPTSIPSQNYHAPAPAQYTAPMTNSTPSSSSVLAFLQSAVASAPPPAVSTLPTSTPDIANLFNSLVQAGIVSGTATANANSVNSNSVPSAQPADPSKEERQEYERNIINMTISLTTADISRQNTGVIPFLYQRMPLQCKQCAIRFHEGAIGKKQMEEHLDMHFRQNRKASENVGRGHNRSWFVGVRDWINDISVDIKGKGRADGHNTKVSAGAAEEEAKLRQSHVLVPPGDETKVIQCPICKETLKPEFLEDDEDWAWKNAVRVQGRIYHATCHAETSTASSLASRLRHEVAVERSRSGTPELSGRYVSGGVNPLSVLKDEIKRSPTPDTRLSGTKRKVEDLDNVNLEASESPPTKKFASSPA
ncbi:hypothetical protein M422DRAFT_22777 [Sphaerobolus stellatus SS14]|nr:hypothetical protein M422DRAFT_22777 [Sphaerobolus stellatus SS14]